MIQAGQVYVHRNGGTYRIVCMARSSNDCHQELVVYESMQDGDFPKGTVWVRTFTEFTTPNRFILLSDAGNL